jgi:outer membrane biosynthesis protein TonB
VTLAWNELQLPWESSSLEDKRFQSILRNFLLALLAFSLVMPWVPVPEVERHEQETLPPQLAQIVLEKKELPKPPTPAEKKNEPEKVVEKPKPAPVVKVKPEPKPKVVPVERPKPEQKKIDQARQKAAVSGLLQFQDDLAQMRDQVDMTTLSSAGLSRGETTSASIDRSVITSRSGKTSGGINAATLSRDTGGAALSGRETTRVSSEMAVATAKAASSTRSASGAQAMRGDEEIRKIMDRNKGAIFSIYNRALRKDPLLSGKMTVQMVINPSGQIAAVKILDSELGDTSLEQKLLARIRMIVFGAKSVASTTLNYSFDFLPY